MENNNQVIDNPLYTTFSFNSNRPYYISISKDISDKYDLYVAFCSDVISKKDVATQVKEMKDLSDVLFRVNPNAILLLASVTRQNIIEFAECNDHKFPLYAKIRKQVYRNLAMAYEFFKGKNIQIKLPVKIIKRDDKDVTFANWLEIDDEALMSTVDYKKIKREYNSLIFSGTKAIPFISTPLIKTEPKTKKLLPYNEGNINIIILITLIMCFILGIGLASLLIK